MKKKYLVVLTILTTLCALSFIIPGILGMVNNSQPETSSGGSYVYVELKSYTVEYNETAEQYQLGMQFWNRYDNPGCIMIFIFAADPLEPTPESFYNHFSAYELYDCAVNISAPGQIEGELSVGVVQKYYGRIYERGYKIDLEYDPAPQYVENPVYVNEHPICSMWICKNQPGKDWL